MPGAARRVLRALLAAALLSALTAAGAAAEGLLEAISGSEEQTYTSVRTKSRDAAKTTTVTGSDGIISRTNLKLNYYLLPTLNLNAGGTYDHSLAIPSGDDAGPDTDTASFRPYVWLNFRDPVFDVSAGYDLADERTHTSGQPTSGTTRQTYNGNLVWRPADLPATQMRLTRATTRDISRTSIDTVQDLFFLKSEYAYRGLQAYYTNTQINTRDEIRDSESIQTAHEGKLLYSTTFLDGRLLATSDNRVRATEIVTKNGPVNTSGLENTGALGVVASDGLFAIDDTPATDPLASTPALVDGDTATAIASINIGFQAGDVLRRNIGLRFQLSESVNRLHVWVDRRVTDNNAQEYSWTIWTSADNQATWQQQGAAVTAPFGRFDNRFELTFPAVRSQFLKVVVQPINHSLDGGVGNTPLFVTEIQAFLDRSAGPTGARNVITQLVDTHTFDLKAILFRSPSLYYNLNGLYQRMDPDGHWRYSATNGLFFTHRLGPVFAASANVSYEVGAEEDEERTTHHTVLTSNASLTATPLRTLTDTLALSRTEQKVEGGGKSTATALTLYNTAQLYRGIDVSLNLGATLTRDELEEGDTTRRRDLSVSVGAAIAPHPSLTTTTYYTGKTTHVSGAVPDKTEHRLDLGLSFTPFRALVLSSAASISMETDKETLITNNFAVNWAPFQDGTLQFAFAYTESRLPDTSRIMQPIVRWYLTSRRRTYLEASYQRSTTESDTTAARTETQIFSTTLSTRF